MQRIGVSDDLYERMRFYASEQNVSIEALIVSVLKEFMFSEDSVNSAIEKWRKEAHMGKLPGGPRP